MSDKKNISGPEIRKCRELLELSQEQLAAKAQRSGWDIGRSVIAKIETGSRHVSDAELLKLAVLLNSSPNELLRHSLGKGS